MLYLRVRKSISVEISIIATSSLLAFFWVFANWRSKIWKYLLFFWKRLHLTFEYRVHFSNKMAEAGGFSGTLRGINLFVPIFSPWKQGKNAFFFLLFSTPKVLLPPSVTTTILRPILLCNCWYRFLLQVITWRVW